MWKLLISSGWYESYGVLVYGNMRIATAAAAVARAGLAFLFLVSLVPLLRRIGLRTRIAFTPNEFSIQNFWVSIPIKIRVLGLNAPIHCSVLKVKRPVAVERDWYYERFYIWEIPSRMNLVCEGRLSSWCERIRWYEIEDIVQIVSEKFPEIGDHWGRQPRRISSRFDFTRR